MEANINRLFYVIIAALFILPVALMFATNHMDLLTTMSGEFAGASLGRSMCSIDFNGDGAQDLIALEKNWNSGGVLDFSYGMFGRINFYWGGLGFDNQIDFAIPGSYQLQYGLGRIINAGDINNDGIDDLCYWGSEQSQEKICIFYGRQNPIATPDYTLSFPHTSVAFLGSVFPLGDINNDNHSDIGYVTVNANYQTAAIKVLDGATLTSTILNSTLWPGTIGSSISGVGDVNNDGIADFHISRALVHGDNTHNSLSLHYGSSSFPVCDSLVISSDTNSLIAPQSCPIGDVNGDGRDDFVSFIDSNGGKVWFGSSDLTPQWDMVIPLVFTGSDGYDLIHGDLNNDGSEDIIATDIHYGGDDGRAYVWLGGHNPNGTLDLTIPFINGISEQFGWAKAAGDFNNDGYCDVAISQPYAQSAPLATPGRIFIYLGNAQLADTTVAVEDENIPSPEAEDWSLDIYPSPNRTTLLKLNLSGSSYMGVYQLTINVYNIKGQSVISDAVNIAQQGNSELSISLPANLAKGIYLVSLEKQGKRLATKRITIL